MPNATEDKDAIREVLAEYCFALDGGQYDAMAALFTADGTWDTAFGAATGRPAIAALARDLRARAGAERPRAIHLVTNIAIALAGDRAEVRSNWIVVQNSPANSPGGPKTGGPKTGGPQIGSGGGYADQMAKVDGVWRFRYRKIDRFIVG